MMCGPGAAFWPAAVLDWAAQVKSGGYRKGGECVGGRRALRNWGDIVTQCSGLRKTAQREVIGSLGDNHIEDKWEQSLNRVHQQGTTQMAGPY